MNMKKSIFLLLGISVLLIFTSCKGDSIESEESGGSSARACFYSYNEGTTKFQWTAFKTTNKVGVAGGFNNITIRSEKSDDPMIVLKSIAFNMSTASVETNNEDRNAKVAKYFFETINTSEITGNVTSINDDGECRISVKMNGVSIDIVGDYTFENNIFMFNSEIDVSSWNALPGITALNNVCEDVHTGEDGISKLWPKVELSFITKLKSDCD
jgi:polyisoprenoid-binding protein YceI